MLPTSGVAKRGCQWGRGLGGGLGTDLPVTGGQWVSGGKTPAAGGKGV